MVMGCGIIWLRMGPLVDLREHCNKGQLAPTLARNVYI
jgi:hypothetical protein